jgi:hypothetical protein
VKRVGGVVHCHKSASSYKNGCRCEDCRAANRVHSREYKRRVRRPDSTYLPDSFVDPSEVREHLLWLHSHGVGPLPVYKACGVDMNTIINIRKGRLSKVRRAPLHAC